MTIVTNSVSKTPLDTALSQIIWYILEPYTKKNYCYGTKNIITKLNIMAPVLMKNYFNQGMGF